MFFKPDNITIMQLYLDSANPEEILLAREWGVIDGVTTNLSLVAKSGVKMEAAISAVLNASPGGSIAFPGGLS